LRQGVNAGGADLLRLRVGSQCHGSKHQRCSSQSQSKFLHKTLHLVVFNELVEDDFYDTATTYRTFSNSPTSRAAFCRGYRAFGLRSDDLRRNPQDAGFQDDSAAPSGLALYDEGGASVHQKRA
jgi:hypothetical protein